jgi:membrane-associated protein
MSATLSAILSHSYPFIFIATFIEGPIVTSAAAFAARLGYLNIFLVLIISFLGDFTADIIYYWLGRLGRLAFIEKYEKRMHITESRMKRIERGFKEHKIKTLVAIKLAPIIPGPGLMLAGAVDVSFQTLLAVSAVVTIPKSLLFAGIGYFLGTTFQTFSHYYNLGAYILIGAAIVIAGVYFFYKKVTNRFTDF